MSALEIHKVSFPTVMRQPPAFIAVQFYLQRAHDDLDTAEHVEIDIALALDPQKSIDATVLEARAAARGLLEQALAALRD